MACVIVGLSPLELIELVTNSVATKGERASLASGRTRAAM